MVDLLSSILGDFIIDETQLVEELDLQLKNKYEKKSLELSRKISSFKIDNFKDLEDTKIRIKFREFLKEITDYRFIFRPVPYSKSEFKMTVLEFLEKTSISLFKI